MTKIKCISMEGGLLEANSYQGPSGIQYTFFKHQFTEVKDQKDAEYFLACGNGKFFVKDGVVEKVKETVKKIVEKKDEKEIPEPAEPVELKTAADIKALNKRSQDFIVAQLKGKDFKSPRLESERIKIILDEQAKGADLNKVMAKLPE